MKCIFLSNVLNGEFVKNNKIDTISPADNIAQIILIEGLYKIYGVDLKVITPSYNDFNNFKHKKENINIVSNFDALGFENNSKNKIIYYLSIIKGYYRELKKLLIEYHDEEIIVITNGPHIFRTLPILLLRKKFKFKFIHFLIASVGLPEYKGIFQLIAKFSPYALQYVDGTITYVTRSSTDYTNKPYVRILYALPKSDLNLSEKHIKNKKINDKKTIFFGGALNDINSFDTIIQLIEKIDDEYKFIICGDGPYKNKLIELQKKYPNKVEYLGLISHEEVIKQEHLANFLIVLRNTRTNVGKYHSSYSMSSKLFEYLLSGTPVIVNKHDAVQEEIRPFFHFIKDESPEEVLNFLNNYHKNEKKILKQSKKGREYVISNATAEVQNQKIINFIEKIMKDK